MNKFIATKNDEGRTILKFLKRIFKDLPLSVIEKAFRKKDIKINGKRINDKKIILKEFDEIVIYGIDYSKAREETIKASVNFKVVYEDKDILVVSKKIGVSIHGDQNSLDNQVLSYLKWKNTDSFTPSHVGRLDKVTSGIMVYGKNYAVLRELKEKHSKFLKVYEFKSDLKEDTETNFRIDHSEDLKREVVSDKGKVSHTKFWLENNNKYAQIFTGRKHQIRVSLSKLGFPIYGDTRYGGKRSDRVYLHCIQLKLQGLSKQFENLNGMEFWDKPNW